MSSRVGEIQWDTPSFPLANERGLLPTPAKDAVNAFLGSAICDVAALAESGYRSLGLNNLANQLAVGRARANCYMGTPPSDFTGEPGLGNAFPGGQCEGVLYQVDFRFQIEGSGISQGSTAQLGPIVRFAEAPFGQFPNALQLIHGDGAGGLVNSQLQGLTATQTIAFAEFIGITRLDGLPDDCGDIQAPETTFQPGVELPPPPAPGQIIRQRELVEITIDIGGNPTPVSVEVGPVTFDPDRGIQIPIPGGCLDLLPDGGIQLEDIVDIADLAQTAANGVGIAQNQSDIEEVKACVCSEISATITSEFCDGGTIVNEVTGTGLQAVMSAISANNGANNNLAGQYCSVLGGGADDVVPTELISYSLVLGNETGSPVAVASDVLSVRVSVSVGDEFPFVYRGTVNNDAQGRFGQVFFGEAIGPRISWSEPRLMYLQDCIFDVPAFTGNDRFVRYSGIVGTTVTIDDSGIR